MIRIFVVAISLCVALYSTAAAAANAGEMEGLDKNPGTYKYCPQKKDGGN